MSTIADLPLKPRVYFLDLNHGYGLSFTDSALSHALASSLDDTPPATVAIAWFATPVESIVEELLSPLYADAGSPLRPGDIVRTKWEDPIAPAGIGLSPKSLSQAIGQMLPDAVLPGLLNCVLRDILIDGDPTLHVVVPDAEAWSIDALLGLGDIPPSICCAVRIRPDDGKTILHNPLRCQSINLRIDSSVVDPKIIVDLLPTSILTLAR